MLLRSLSNGDRLPRLVTSAEYRETLSSRLSGVCQVIARLSRMKLKTVFRACARGDDRGQTVLIVAAVLMAVALTATAVFVNLSFGQRTLDRLKSGSSTQGLAHQALLA